MQKNKGGLPFVLGITDKNTVKLDFDNTKFKWVKYWAKRTMKWFKLKGFVILKSSKKSYHVVFDKKVSWEKNVKIMAWVSLLSQNKNLQKWFLMQCIKGGSTLRVSAKKDKPEPRIVFRYGCQGNMVAEFLAYREIVKDIALNVAVSNLKDAIKRTFEQKHKLKTESILECFQHIHKQ